MLSARACLRGSGARSTLRTLAATSTTTSASSSPVTSGGTVRSIIHISCVSSWVPTLCCARASQHSKSSCCCLLRTFGLSAQLDTPRKALHRFGRLETYRFFTPAHPICVALRTGLPALGIAAPEGLHWKVRHLEDIADGSRQLLWNASANSKRALDGTSGAADRDDCSRLAPSTPSDVKVVRLVGAVGFELEPLLRAFEPAGEIQAQRRTLQHPICLTVCWWAL